VVDLVLKGRFSGRVGRYCEKCGKRKASSRCDHCSFIDYYNGTSLHRYLNLPSTIEQYRQLLFGKSKDPEKEKADKRHSKPEAKQSFQSTPKYVQNPDCPDCGEEMVLRTAKRGMHMGKKFWGCGAFPDCRQILEYKEEHVVSVDEDKEKEPIKKPPHLPDGKKDGLYNEWYENGQKQKEGNYKEAVKWYTKSAEQGDANAQFMVGGCYALGLGVAKNSIEGYAWCNIAIANGHEKAKEWIMEIELSSEQLIEAQALSAEIQVKRIEANQKDKS
jgi:ssDNA-binding Zn-finger/Zn-ribbon topoisomerase 1